MKKRYSRTLLIATAALAATSTQALANPNGGSVVAGQATVAQTTPAQVTITQSTDKAIINWNSFSIGAGEKTRFVQPSSNSITLNRVTGPDVSQILGQLTANGRIVLVNPNGVFFGKDSQVDVTALIATSHDIKNDDFMAGKLNFTIPGKPGAQIINQGKITVQEGGLVALVAPSVQNSGLITARLGKVTLASANSFTIDLYGDNLILFEADSAITSQLQDALGNPLAAAVENSGAIEANGGWVLLTAEVAKNVVDKAINMTGHIKATSVDQQEGTIILKAMGGEVAVSGTLDASAPNGGDGGFIETSGAHVTIDPAAKITTIAPFGKTGRWLIDPTDYTIAASGGDITGASLSTYLGASNVEIQTLATGSSGQGDIFVSDAVTWDSLNKLTLTAHRNINVNAAINATGGGKVKLRADSLGTGTGTVFFAGNGHITVNHPWASVYIYYNPVSYNDAATKSTLVNNPFSGNVTLNDGSGLLANMLVNNVNQLQEMSTNMSGRYALGKDIDASATAGWNGGAGFVPLGYINDALTEAFTGYFNGEGHIISNLTINRPSTNLVALIGFSLGSVVNVGLVNNNFTGNSFVGGLVASNSAGIFDSYVTGSVSGADYVGGLVGESSGTIFSSYASCSVSSTNPARAGGLVAENSGGVSDSYWDTQASGQATSAEGTGLTTAQMKQQASFSGFDFTNTWQIVEGVSRPTLKVASAQSATVLTPTVLTPTGDTPSGNPDSSLLISYVMPQNTYKMEPISVFSSDPSLETLYFAAGPSRQENPMIIPDPPLVFNSVMTLDELLQNNLFKGLEGPIKSLLLKTKAGKQEIEEIYNKINKLQQSIKKLKTNNPKAIETRKEIRDLIKKQNLIKETTKKYVLSVKKLPIDKYLSTLALGVDAVDLLMKTAAGQATLKDTESPGENAIIAASILAPKGSPLKNFGAALATIKATVSIGELAAQFAGNMSYDNAQKETMRNLEQTIKSSIKSGIDMMVMGRNGSISDAKAKQVAQELSILSGKAVGDITEIVESRVTITKVTMSMVMGRLGKSSSDIKDLLKIQQEIRKFNYDYYYNMFKLGQNATESKRTISELNYLLTQ